MKNTSGYVLQARDIFLRKHQVSTHENLSLTFHPLTLTFLLITVITFVVFDAGNLRENMALWQIVLVWGGAVFLQIGLYCCFAILWSWGQKTLGLPVIYLPILGLLSFMINYPTTITHMMLQSGLPFSTFLETTILINGTIFFLLFETAYFAYVFPPLHQKYLESHGLDQRNVLIAGETFRIDQILTLRGQEHYVLVTTDDGDHRLRARLSDIVSQTQENDGILAHRSHWISRHAIAGVERENGADFILTHSGERLPVARPRQGEVRGWIEQHARLS